jgi:putative membrane protein
MLDLMSSDPARRRLPVALFALTLVLLVVSGWRPYDRPTWWLEVAPVLVALPILAITHRRNSLTSLAYVCIFVHACILMLGGAYTYARVPIGFELQQWLGLDRNPYDRIGHLAQGFVPALIAREILIRGDYVRGSRMRAFLIVCVVLAISATYELIEWAVALIAGQGADQFLGTQGDVWDTQWDMFCALIGAVTGLALLSRLHDRQLAEL